MQIVWVHYKHKQKSFYFIKNQNQIIKSSYWLKVAFPHNKTKECIDILMNQDCFKSVQSTIKLTIFPF